MATFGTVTFSERGQAGAFLPLHPTKYSYTIIKIPGGDTWHVQGNDFPYVPFACPVQVTAAQLTALNAAANTSASLVYAGGTVTALLEKVEIEEVKASKDYYQGTLNFQVAQ